MGFAVGDAERALLAQHNGDVRPVLEELMLQDRPPRAVDGHPDSVAALERMGYPITDAVLALVERHNGDTAAVVDELDALPEPQPEEPREPIPEAPASEYPEAVTALENMGFVMTPDIEELLTRHQGDMGAVLEALL